MAGAHEAKLRMQYPTAWIDLNSFVYFNATLGVCVCVCVCVCFLRARPLRMSEKSGVATELRTAQKW